MLPGKTELFDLTADPREERRRRAEPGGRPRSREPPDRLRQGAEDERVAESSRTTLARRARLFSIRTSTSTTADCHGRRRCCRKVNNKKEATIPISRKHPVPAATLFCLVPDRRCLLHTFGRVEEVVWPLASGSMALFVDSAPLKETFIVRANVVNHNGVDNASKPILIGTDHAWRRCHVKWGWPDASLASSARNREGPEPAMDATTLYIAMDVSADVEATAAALSAPRAPAAPTAGRHRPHAADAELHRRPATFTVDFRTLAPTRRRATTRSGGWRTRARTSGPSSRRWACSMYRAAESASEALAIYSASDFNTENEDTDYQSGTQCRTWTARWPSTSRLSRRPGRGWPA
ncbi:MAG: hypothetical protein MZV70_40020 [Desulfobacterales bacterium]|nr:hypothetical protein [Desulfobacterales bacterium]